MKKSYFFRHYDNVFDNEDVFLITYDYGYAGYGLYWRIMERLNRADNNVLELSDRTYKMLSLKDFSKDMVEEFILKCINEYGVFSMSDQYFYSDEINDNSKRVQKLVEQRVNAANKRWAKDKDAEA